MTPEKVIDTRKACDAGAAPTDEWQAEAPWRFSQKPSFDKSANAHGDAQGDPIEFPAPANLYLDAELKSLKSRALAYLKAGVPIHFRGRAGMGKTTLAMHLAQDLSRPVVFLTGDHGLDSKDLFGREIGQDSRSVHDQYVNRVKRTESSTRILWHDGILTRAMIEGQTLIYDEFTRTPPETNNALLAALEERLIVIPNPLRGTRVVKAHSEFRAIFTSNPDEYAGVKSAPDALLDRMITFDMSGAAPDTEAGIVATRTGIGLTDARMIVQILRSVREEIPGDNPPSLRTAVIIGRIVRLLDVPASARSETFVQICLDALEARAPSRTGAIERERYVARLRAQIVAVLANRSSRTDLSAKGLPSSKPHNAVITKEACR
ncbi:MAG: gas vesicle protein GvpN [Paracoccaceae bacterium]